MHAAARAPGKHHHQRPLFQSTRRRPSTSSISLDRKVGCLTWARTYARTVSWAARNFLGLLSVPGRPGMRPGPVQTLLKARPITGTNEAKSRFVARLQQSLAGLPLPAGWQQQMYQEAAQQNRRVTAANPQRGTGHAGYRIHCTDFAIGKPRAAVAAGARYVSRHRRAAAGERWRRWRRHRRRAARSSRCRWRQPRCSAATARWRRWSPCCAARTCAW